MTQRSIDEWRAQGVILGEEVDPERIAANAVIHAGSTIRGAKTSIGPGSVIGAEAPATVENCQLARGVQLKGGFFSNAVFLDGSNLGLGAHVRGGTILEEEAGGAHTVGLKQTILQPFVTLGSLINFCDVMMAGGTSRKDHSEVGSSYVHFNFTPHQDKATASLIGDVPQGVFLNQNPIFLGGQGGLVGPARIAYGSVIAAGGVCREDALEADQLHIAEAPAPGSRPYTTGVYRRADRLIRNNLAYIGNLWALRAWYEHVRSQFIRDAFDGFVLEGALANLDGAIKERVKRLGAVADNFGASADWLDANGGKADEIAAQKAFHAQWATISNKLNNITTQPSAEFTTALEPNGTYVETIQSMSAALREAGSTWLQGIVDEVTSLWENN